MAKVVISTIKRYHWINSIHVFIYRLYIFEEKQLSQKNQERISSISVIIMTREQRM